MHYQKILLAISDAMEEKKVIDEALFLTSVFNAKLSILAVNDPGAGKAHMLMDSLPRVSREDIIKQLHRSGHDEKTEKIDIKLIESESYARAITGTSKGFDLLVMGHHHKNRLLAFFRDSTDELVADKIECPVLLVPL